MEHIFLWVDFISIVVYVKPAENYAKYLAKASKVIVQGKIEDFECEKYFKHKL